MYNRIIPIVKICLYISLKHLFTYEMLSSDENSDSHLSSLASDNLASQQLLLDNLLLEGEAFMRRPTLGAAVLSTCLLYTSDAADE